jgi:transketolase
MRDKFAETFYDLGCKDPRLCIIVADISPAGSMSKFRTEFPARFINTGVSEQIMIGMAAGMAQRGFRPFVYTIATFALYRPLEFIRIDLAYQNLPVTIVGIGSGVSYSTLGATHHTYEDIAIASAIPNISIISPCDPLEVIEATKWCASNTSGPVYLRLGRAGEPNITSEIRERWEFGKVRCLIKGTRVALITYGVLTSMVVEITQQFTQNSTIQPSIYLCSTLKPLDYSKLVEILEDYESVVVVEDHVDLGGLGMQIRALNDKSRLRAKIFQVGLNGNFAKVYGTSDEVLDSLGSGKETLIDLLRAINS